MPQSIIFLLLSYTALYWRTSILAVYFLLPLSFGCVEKGNRLSQVRRWVSTLSIGIGVASSALLGLAAATHLSMDFGTLADLFSATLPRHVIYALLSIAVLQVGGALRSVSLRIGGWQRAGGFSLILLCLFGTTAIQLAVAPKGYLLDLSRHSYLDAFDETVRAISRYYPYLELKGIDIGKVAANLRPSLVGRPSADDFEATMVELLAALMDGHARILGGRLQSEHQYAPNISLCDVEGRIIVTQVGEPKLTESGLLPGLELLKINDTLATDMLGLLPPYLTAAGTPQFTHFLAGRYLLSGPYNSSFRAELVAPNGTAVSLNLTRSVPVSRVGPRKTPEARTIGEDVLYIRIPRFSGSPDPAKFVRRQLSSNLNVPYLIIDVRGNGGGDDRLSRRINNLLLSERLTYGHYVSAAATERFIYSIRPSKLHYSGRIFVLVDEGCFSATADFIEPLHQTKRATLVGRPIGGGGGNPTNGRIRLPDGLIARFPISAFVGPGGDYLHETSGIPPDVTVRPTVDQVREGIDSELQSALQIIASERSSAHGG